MAKPDIERRHHAELRMVDDKEGRMLVGYAAVFDTPTEIGNFFREQISPGAFASAIADDDIRALFDHDSALVLGRNRAGTLRLSEDDKGLRVEIDVPETTIGNDLLVSMKRGDINQMSFGFQVLKETWDDEQTPPLRTLDKVSLFDVSVVTYPAYPEAGVSVRAKDHAGEILKKSNARPTAIAVAMRMKQGMLERGIR
jgi:HK97 family phage prohead protease